MDGKCQEIYLTLPVQFFDAGDMILEIKLKKERTPNS
jgi:hypothetical protein